MAPALRHCLRWQRRDVHTFPCQAGNERQQWHTTTFRLAEARLGDKSGICTATA